MRASLPQRAEARSGASVVVVRRAAPQPERAPAADRSGRLDAAHRMSQDAVEHVIRRSRRAHGQRPFRAQHGVQRDATGPYRRRPHPCGGPRPTGA